MIYKGNQKEGKVYIGGTKIGKIYKGGQLVYQANSLKIYNYHVYNDIYWYYGYVINEISTNSLIAIGTEPGFATINNITGTLGASNSTVTANNITYNYITTTIVNNIRIYLYSRDDGYWYSSILVLENSIIGSTVLCDKFSMNYNFNYPTYIDNNVLRVSYLSMDFQRNSAGDKIWSINGVY